MSDGFTSSFFILSLSPSLNEINRYNVKSIVYLLDKVIHSSIRFDLRKVMVQIMRWQFIAYAAINGLFRLWLVLSIVEWEESPGFFCVSKSEIWEFSITALIIGLTLTIYETMQKQKKSIHFRSI